jgi:pilus assembly protein Flp/PilA
LWRTNLDNDRTTGTNGVPSKQKRQEKMDLVTVWHYLQAKSNIAVDEKGASLVEYALLVALIAVVCIAAITLLGNSASTKFSVVGGSIGGS